MAGPSPSKTLDLDDAGIEQVALEHLADVMRQLGLEVLLTQHRDRLNGSISRSVDRTRPLISPETGSDAVRILLTRSMLSEFSRAIPRNGTSGVSKSDRSKIRRELLKHASPREQSDPSGKWLDPFQWSEFGAWFRNHLESPENKDNRQALLHTVLELVDKVFEVQDNAVRNYSGSERRGSEH